MSRSKGCVLRQQRTGHSNFLDFRNQTGMFAPKMSAGTEPSPSDAVEATGTNSARLLLFTWNLHENPAALELACEHLENQGSYVACFQELPTDDEFSLHLVAAKHGARVLTRPAFQSDLKSIRPKIALLASDDITIDWIGNALEYRPDLDDMRRLQGFTVESEKSQWRNLQVMGVHGWDRLKNPSERQRDRWGAIMRDDLDEFWTKGPLVLMGDFNANPWHAEITNRDHLCALRKKDLPLKGDTKKIKGRKKDVEPLYNPMWHVLPDRENAAHGTISYVDENDLRWHCFDQILLSQHFCVQHEPPKILTSLLAHELVDTNGTPTNENKIYKWSQHLPVQMTIKIGEVKACRI